MDIRFVRNGYVILRFGGVPPLQECTADAVVKAMNDWCVTSGTDLDRAHFSSDGCRAFSRRHQDVAAQLQKKYSGYTVLSTERPLRPLMLSKT